MYKKHIIKITVEPEVRRKFICAKMDSKHNNLRCLLTYVRIYRKNQRYYATISLNNESFRTPRFLNEGRMVFFLEWAKGVLARKCFRNADIWQPVRLPYFRSTRTEGPVPEKLPFFFTFSSLLSALQMCPSYVVYDTLPLRANKQIIIMNRENPTVSASLIMAKVLC